MIVNGFIVDRGSANYSFVCRLNPVRWWRARSHVGGGRSSGRHVADLDDDADIEEELNERQTYHEPTYVT